MTSGQERLSAALAGRYRLERELAAVLGAECFIVDIKTTAALQHPHILPLFDSGEADGFLYYVMPYIQGETIREKLNRETQCGVDEAVRIAREVPSDESVDGSPPPACAIQSARSSNSGRSSPSRSDRGARTRAGPSGSLVRTLTSTASSVRLPETHQCATVEASSTRRGVVNWRRCPRRRKISRPTDSGCRVRTISREKRTPRVGRSMVCRTAPTSPPESRP